MYLNDVIYYSDKIKYIAKEKMAVWDCLLVKTYNSLYTIRKTDDHKYIISGGWFEKKGYSYAKVSIRGCTWGGSIIHINMLAAIGLSIEFGNNLITSPVTQIFIIRAENLN